MSKFNLYVTDWAPNGTNDLLICDEDHQLVASIQECTFGIDVTKRSNGESLLVADDAGVFPVDAESEEEWTTQHNMPEDLVLVRQISLDDLKRRVACSPVDPDGSSVLASIDQAINKAGAK